MDRLDEIFRDASDRYSLKELVWQIYHNPEKVKKAIEVLRKLLEE